MVEQPQKKIYSDSKLDRVSYEIRFDPFLEIVTRIADFQKEMRPTLPKHFPKKLYRQDSIGVHELTEHNFTSKNGNLILRVSSENFVLTTRQYESFESFKQSFLDILDKFLEKFVIGEFTFIGMRYINQFEFDMDTIKLDKVLEYFNLGSNQDRIKNTAIEIFKLDEKYEINNANFKRYFGFIANFQLKKYGIVLDLDSNFINIELNPKELPDKLDKLHSNIKVEFENSITPACEKEVLGLR